MCSAHLFSHWQPPELPWHLSEALRPVSWFAPALYLLQQYWTWTPLARHWSLCALRSRNRRSWSAGSPCSSSSERWPIGPGWMPLLSPAPQAYTSWWSRRGKSKKKSDNCKTVCYPEWSEVQPAVQLNHSCGTGTAALILVHFLLFKTALS